MGRLNTWRVYLQPFDDDGNYLADWTEITEDVIFDQMGTIQEQLDNTDYDIGFFVTAAFQIVLKNESGAYSDVDNSKSIFHYRRSGTKVKITWEIAEAMCGTAECGEVFLSEEQEVFQGIIDDEAASQDLDTNEIRLTCVGRESLFESEVVPIDDLTNGDLVSEAIYTILNQANFTRVLTIEQVNIVCSVDSEIDDVSVLEGKTCKEALDELLASSNSIIRILDDVVYVSARTASTDVEGYFYGQGSTAGPENIQTMKNIKTGTAKIFNYLKWEETTTAIEDATSVDFYGVFKKEIAFDFITDTTKRQAIMQSIVDEFKDPKQEFELSSPLSFDNVNLHLLDKCQIDYPVVYIEGETEPAICGIAKAGEWTTPKALWDFSVDDTDRYKIMTRKLDPKNSMVTFRMRKI